MGAPENKGKISQNEILHMKFLEFTSVFTILVFVRSVIDSYIFVTETTMRANSKLFDLRSTTIKLL